MQFINNVGKNKIDNISTKVGIANRVIVPRKREVDDEKRKDKKMINKSDNYNEMNSDKNQLIGMKNDIKSEFKEFISTLSTEICKQVLLEELKEINNSFEKTEESYKTLYNNYTKNINSIKDQLEQLQSTNQKLGDFIANINNNSINVNKALDVINGEHKVITDKIIKDNNKLFNEFSDKVSSLNETERYEFITQLTSSMNAHSKKYMIELSNIVNGSKIENIRDNLSLVLTKINKINNDVNGIVSKVHNSEKTIISSVKENILENEINLTTKIQVTNSKIDTISNELNNKISVLSDKINKSNNIIIVLASVIIVLCIVLIIRT